MATRPKTTTVSPIQSESLATPSPPKASGSSLRRSSSFSGVTAEKQQEVSPKSDSETGKGRGRSSSFSGSKQEHSVQITVDGILWIHLKKAYKLRIAELTSEIQMTEKHSERSKDMIFLLTGTNSSKVTACQEGLQRLIDTVSVDFTIKSISLSDLGVADSTNDILHACCAEIHSRYKKISVEITEKTLHLLGPKVLCSEVFKLLCEVFSGAQHSAVQQDYSRPSTSDGSDGSRRAQINGANGQVSPRKDAVIREKVKVENYTQNAQESVPKTSINGSVTSRVDKTKRQQTAAVAGGRVCAECKSAGAAVKKTLCGVALCTNCLIMHSQCRVCESREEPKTWGIQGKMTYTTLSMSLPGHIRDPTIKITYSIPDGIQGENDPSPGKPFKGGTFEAFLPDCEQTRKLLPRLERAFKWGYTFTVTAGRVNWDIIPHKTSLQGGKSVSGYPDSSYLKRLSDILDAKMIY
uniref:E3 ubiquitin-protein ligase n=1 Tax=Neogobius melanostomus TaxID=47308 RepID=A0A8C6UQU8_9GOBI